MLRKIKDFRRPCGLCGEKYVQGPEILEHLKVHYEEFRLQGLKELGELKDENGNQGIKTEEIDRENEEEETKMKRPKMEDCKIDMKLPKEENEIEIKMPKVENKNSEFKLPKEENVRIKSQKIESDHYLKIENERNLKPEEKTELKAEQEHTGGADPKLKAEVLEVHNEIETCVFCDQLFLNKDFLNLHINEKHQNIQILDCSECGFLCTSSKELRDHKFVHTGEKPYACDICDSSFHESKRLEEHRIEQHPQVSTERFSCTVCGLGFVEKDDVKTHMGIHLANMVKDREEEHVGNEMKADDGDLENKENMIENKIEIKECKVNLVKMEYDTFLSQTLKGKTGIKNEGGRSTRNSIGFEKSCFEQRKMKAESETIAPRESKIVKGLERPKRKRRPTREVPPSSEDEDDDTPFKCKECKVSFKKEHHFRLHMNRHTIGKTFECKKCRMNLRTLGALTNHERNFCIKT